MFDEATQRLDQHAPKTPHPRETSSAHSHDSIDDARFVPGTIFGERYRIVGLLGRGGMGEVYRADDLKLAQPVALKFLPDRLLSDGAALARFHREVRVARQVSHKNVCRVYDIGEVDGRHFLSMEFIRGEELSSLTRRIGRLPQDKAVQLARQICAGLAAAHEAGVMHRDLKPANIMIDELGNARITDFGLAGLEEELRSEEAIAGTPAYMAPEQLEGKPFTVRSDIYSLGLLLYELFTGKKAFDAPTLNELIKLRRTDTTPTTPTSLVQNLDPLIEKVIDRCIQKDPEQRPSSALQVAAALPGGDPLAAALAAGETPSPEMVAAAPRKGVLKPAVAIALLASFVGLITLCAWLTRYTAPYRVAPTGDSPEVLKARAREVIRNLGYTRPPNDAAYDIVFKDDFLRYVADHDQSASRWSRLATEGGGVYRFMYRETPRYFEPYENKVTAETPALDVSGMTLVYLDMPGNLHWFIGVPPQREPPPDPSQKSVDWSVPFHEAGFDINAFQPVASSNVPLHAYDVRSAWEGPDPGEPNIKVHVEGAAFRGRLVYFETIYPWDSPIRQELPPVQKSERALDVVVISVFALALGGSVLLARGNLKAGRGDRRGATRIALFSFSIFVVLRLLGDHHTGDLFYEMGLFLSEASLGLFGAVFLWLMYVALEPFVRRQWPERIVSWSRLLAGGLRDPLIGRDILIGSAAGSLSMLCGMLPSIGLRWIGRPPELTANPANYDLAIRLGHRIVNQISIALVLGLIFMFLLLLLFRILHRERLALIALWIFLTIPQALISRVDIRMLPLMALVMAVQVFVLARYGLLALIASLFTLHMFVFFPMTTDLSVWYARNFLVDAAICLAMAGFACYTSLAGQPLFGGKFIQD